MGPSYPPYVPSPSFALRLVYPWRPVEPRVRGILPLPAARDSFNLDIYPIAFSRRIPTSRSREISISKTSLSEPTPSSLLLATQPFSKS
ncbi:hypothetical protein JMJ35_000448 [Cladonia borealis]|uniref:Uncharacterized protein n=1 Tax=Cladonia borealis TaxID=184061 RepID=A0AA39R9G4_9LECA|nr:hypothetical protein JMJ35_000448 [Cladonia borealis]